MHHLFSFFIEQALQNQIDEPVYLNMEVNFEKVSASYVSNKNHRPAFKLQRSYDKGLL